MSSYTLTDLGPEHAAWVVSWHDSWQKRDWKRKDGTSVDWKVEFSAALAKRKAEHALGTMKTFGSLFAGIGGFDLGFEQSGMTPVWNVELDEDCRHLLKAKFPGAEQHEDVREVGKQNLAPVDVVCGGFPCQDLSVAGKRAGLSGARSGLFYELSRIVHELQPAFVVWENVPGLFSSEDGRDLANVMLELWRRGYHGAWRTFDAQYIGVAQRRRRIFGVFARADIGAARCAEILSLAEGLRGHPAPSRETGKDLAPTLEGRAGRSGATNFHTSGGLAVAGTLNARNRAGGGLGTDFECGVGLVPEVARCLNAGRDGYNDGSDQTYIPVVCGAITDGAHNGGGLNGQDAYTGRIIAVGGGLPLGAGREGDGQRHEAGTPDSDPGRRFL